MAMVIGAGGSVIIWACFCWHGLRPILTIKYLQSNSTLLSRLYDMIFDGNGLHVFQHGNAPTHIALSSELAILCRGQPKAQGPLSYCGRS